MLHNLAIAPVAREILAGDVAAEGPHKVTDSGATAEPGAVVAAFREWLATIDGAALSDTSRLTIIAELERLKGAAAAAQARVTVAFALDAQEAALARCADADPRQVRAQTTRSVGSQVALARRESPWRADRLVGMANALVREMPHTLAALTAGDTHEWGATIMVRDTAALTLHDRQHVDAQLGPQLARMSATVIDKAARRMAAQLDAAAIVARNDAAVASRRVSMRPAPDGMAYLTLLAPLKEAVAAYAALHAHAQSVTAGTAWITTGDTAAAHGTGDPTASHAVAAHVTKDTAAAHATGEQPRELPDGRGRGAIMADAAIARLTGRTIAEPAPVEVHVVMTDRALIGSGDPTRSTDEPAWLPGYGPVPAAIARTWIRDANARVWLRRLYTTHTGRDLVAMDSRRRVFTGQLRRMVLLRDDTCRTPYCDAPISHGDHVHPHRADGATSYANGAGLCARCNLTKEAPGWRHAVTTTEPHTIEVTTPTGHTYDSTAPPLLGDGWTPPPEPQTHDRVA